MKDNDVRTWLYYHLPLTLAVQKDKMLRKLIGKNIGSLLDVGCGIGKYKVFAKHYSVGIDIFENSLEMSKRNGYYYELILGDVRNLDFANKSFDGVICTDVIEHISKEDGYKLLDKMESISRKIIVITTPWGSDLIKRHNPNPYNDHHSGWMPEEFEARGYKIIPLNSLRWRRYSDGWTETAIHYGLSILCSPIVYLFPKWLSDNFMAVKEIE